MPDALPWTMTLREFRKAFPATRCFQHYDHNQRADRAASFRLGHRQLSAVGEFYYTHKDCPGVAFRTHGDAIRTAHLKHVRAALEEGKDVPMHVFEGYSSFQLER